MTPLDSLSQVAKHKGKDDADLVEMESPPEAFKYIWDWFWELNSMRQSGFSANALSPSDMGWWQYLSGKIIRPWEFELLQSMDRVYMNFKAEKHKEKTSKNKL